MISIHKFYKNRKYILIILTKWTLCSAISELFLDDEFVFGSQALETVIRDPALVAEKEDSVKLFTVSSHHVYWPQVRHAGLPTGAVLLCGLEGGAGAPGEGVREHGLPVVTWRENISIQHMIQHLKCFLLTLSEPHKEAEDCKQKNMSHNATFKSDPCN